MVQFATQNIKPVMRCVNPVSFGISLLQHSSCAQWLESPSNQEMPTSLSQIDAKQKYPRSLLFVDSEEVDHNSVPVIMPSAKVAR